MLSVFICTHYVAIRGEVYTLYLRAEIHTVLFKQFDWLNYE